MNGRFSAIPREMLDDGRVTALDAAVYAVLDSFAGSGGAACPSIPAIAARAKVSMSTVKRALCRLGLAGYVIRRQRRIPDSRERDATLYRLAFRGNGAGAGGCPIATPDTGSDRAECSPETADRPALMVSSVGTGGTEVSSEGGDIPVLSIQEAGSDGWHSPALAASDVGPDGTGAGSGEGNTPAISAQDAGSEGAGKHTHGTGVNEREHGLRCLPACVGPVSPVVPSIEICPPEEITNGGMTHGECVDKLFDEFWELYPQKIYKGDAKEALSALFPEGISRETAERRLRAITGRFTVLEQNAKRLIRRGDSRFIGSSQASGTGSSKSVLAMSEPIIAII